MLWWIDSCACLTVKLLAFLVGILPVESALWLGRRVGDSLLFAKPRRARIAYVNLKWAFGARYTPAERRQIVREAYQTLGQTGVELLRLRRIDAAYVDRHITVRGTEHLEAALARGKGIIFLTGHFGNWELSSIVGALKGYPMVALAREQKLPRLYKLLTEIRESKGCRVIGKGMALRSMVRELRANRIVGIVGDQGAKTQGVRVQLFGREALSPVGPVELALRTGATVLPTFIRRVHGAQHVIEVEEPLDVSPHGQETPDQTVVRALQAFMERLEAQVREAPGQWLWMHRRWKSTPRRHALVLSDGKAGHLKQSLAVVAALRAERGETVTHDVIDVGFRSPAHRVWAAIATWLPGISPTWILRATLTTRAALLDTPCDYVISCGAATAAANVWLARDNDAAAVVIMRPALIALRHFRLAFIPRHDQPPARPNVVVTLGALSDVTPERLTAAGDRLSGLTARPLSPNTRRIGLLLGGDTDETQLTPSLVEATLNALEPVCRDWPAQLLVTTSRRTALAVEQLCDARLRSHPACPLLVLANRDNPAGMLDGILGAAQLLVVSGESSSMVSEAVASGRPVIVLQPEPKPSRRVPEKRRRFLEALAAQGAITVTSVDGLSDALRAAAPAAAPHEPADWTMLRAAVRRLP